MPYKNSEKRKEKSRDAARSRRGKESEVFSELSMHLPVSPVVLSTLDKASTMRVAISHLKLRKLLGPAPCEHPSGVDHMIDRAYMQSLNGFLMVLARDGDIVYLSENCSQHLGLSQIELIGQSMFDFIHMSDRATVREVLEKATPKHKETEFDFFVRLKCTLTSKGKNINLKSATFKVLHCTGRCVTVKETADDKGITCLIVVAEPIPHPVNIEIFLDSNTHLTTHNLDMSIQFCDAKLCKLLGFTEEEMTQKSMYDLYHAADIQRLHTSFKLMKEMGQIKTGVYRLLAKGGGYVYVDTEATIICNVHTGAEEHIVCVNYIISGVEEPNLILADFQMADFQMSSTCVPVDEMIPAAAIKEDTDDVILSTESIFSSLTTHDDPSIEDDSCYATQAPSAGDVMVALDYNNQDPKLVGVESLLLRVDPASGEELLTSPPYSASSESIMPQSTVPSDVDTPPGLVDLISDSDTESSSSQTLIIDPEEVDMCQRAPYISMSGDDDLMFPMETSGDTGMEELSVGANVMLGRTESVFNSMPTEDEEEDEEGSHKSHNVPFPILRQLATHSKKREYSQGNQHSPAKPLSTPTETNRLETGPPHPTKRVRLSSDANSGMCVSEKSADLSAVGGSSVLMNLLLCGEDVQNGYSIPPPLPKPPSPAQSMSSLSSSASSSPVSDHGGTLRDLLTCPLEPSLSSSCASSPTSSPSPKIYPATASSTVINSPSAKQYITFDPAIMKVLGLTTNSSSAL